MGSMEIYKRTSKGGGFLNLFDWNSKSKKKLFSDNSNGPESLNQGKVKQETLPESSWRLQTNAEEENASSSNSRRPHWNCDSSSSPSHMDCNGRGAHAPGVVARLMGLDSMPTLSASQSFSTSSLGSNFPRVSHYYDKQDSSTRDPWIERFQTEVLPPRSAKPISLTHHKLLSPIKNPTFIPVNDAAHIMEAAAKIIEASPRKPVTVTKVVRPITSASSLPMRIQDLKMKLEAQQPKKLGNSRILNGKSNNGAPKGIMGNARAMKRDVDPGSTSRSSNSKAKADMQRREGKVQTFNRNLANERELKNSQRRASTNKTGAKVLSQNNQKQNSLSDKFGSVSKASLGGKISQNKTRTVSSASSMPLKTVKSNSQRNLSSISSYSGTMKNTSQKKGAADREISSVRSVAMNVLISNDERPLKSKMDTDVISFTFMSPIKKSVESQSPVRAVNGINNFDSGKKLTFYAPDEGMSGESSLSMLLEQKLRELKDRVESYIVDGSCTSTSSFKEDEEEDSLSTCTSSFQDSVCTLSHSRSANAGPYVDEMSSPSSFDYSSTIDRRRKRQAQVIETTEEFNTSATRSRNGRGGSSPESTVTCCDKEESLDLHSAVDSLAAEDNRTELSDQRENYVTPLYRSSNNWEIEYIRDILAEAESTVRGSSSTHLSEIINPTLFDELENHGNTGRSDFEGEANKLRRKVLFDYVSESLLLRCRDLLVGAPNGWARFSSLFKRKGLLAEQIYRELTAGNCIGDMMVDVLVDEDMSCKFGNWLDFRVEMFEEGVDIGEGIVSSLVDELVAEFVVLSC